METIDSFTYNTTIPVQPYIQPLIETLTGYFSITDTIASGTWYTTVESSTFTGTYDTIASSSIFMSHPSTPRHITGDVNPFISMGTGWGGYLSLDTPRIYIQATSWSTNKSIYTTDPLLKIDVPAYTSPWIYSGMITYTLYTP